MDVLIIEDNDIKFSLIEECLREIDLRIQLRRAASYQSGIEALVERECPCVILDMTLPVFDAMHSLVGMDVLTFGGELILRESARKRIDAKFIILSQYDTFVRGEKEVTFEQLRLELLAKYPKMVLGCVRLDSTSVSWKTELCALIESTHEDFGR